MTVEQERTERDPVEPERIDGRTARRDRNRIAVLDAVLALFAEGEVAPSPEAVAARSGLSPRSVYRYVADADDLLRAAIARHIEKVAPLFTIDDLGSGALDHRLDAFLQARLRGYEAIAPTARASRARAATNQIIRDELDHSREVLRLQLERQFAPELDQLPPDRRDAALAAADALTQTETIELYRHHRGCSIDETHAQLAAALRVLLTGKY
jgi:AcrR family transcriptional regulator